MMNDPGSLYPPTTRRTRVEPYPKLRNPRGWRRQGQCVAKAETGSRPRAFNL